MRSEGLPATASASPRVLRSGSRPRFAGWIASRCSAVVHRFSSHALMLRYWLAYAGIDPDEDVELRVLPPPFMATALAAGEIDGFSAGEPWNSTAVDSGAGEIVALGCRIWESGPEKVLAMREDWTEADPDTVDRLLRALRPIGGMV